MNVAWLGTGIMGAPMARHVAQAGEHVRAWNRSAEKAQPLAEGGARIAKDPAEAVDGADVVVTMLADADATEEVMRAATPCVRSGAVWWQAGTIGLEGIERCAALAGELGVALVDGPVLGTRQPRRTAS